MKRLFQNLYKKNSLAATFLFVVIILFLINLSIKSYQYAFGNIYKGEIVDIESFEVTKYGGSKYSGSRSYKSHVFPQKIKFTDNENKVWYYSEPSWEDEMKYEMNEKIEVLETKDGKIYILRLFSFWLNTTNLVVIFGVSVFLTFIIEMIKDNITSK